LPADRSPAALPAARAIARRVAIASAAFEAITATLRLGSAAGSSK
jgi:hypothetical protein